MANFEKSHVTLDPQQLAVLEWWIFKVCKSPIENHHISLLLRVLMEIWEKKIHPKSPLQRKNKVKLKLSAVQTMALTMSFVIFDWGDSSVANVGLYFIQEQLPKLQADDLIKFIPPDVKIL